MSKSVILSLGVVLGSCLLAQAGPNDAVHPRLHAVERVEDVAHGTKYLCQKCYGGCWQTVKVCYCYADAMAWYDNQPSNARVIAQK